MMDKKVYGTPPTLVLLLFFLQSCGIGYVLKQGSIQYKIINESVSIQKLLNDEKVEKNIKDKIVLIQQVKDFVKEFGYDISNVYATYYDTKGKPIAYTVVASRKDALEPKVWNFLFVGSFSYLGFFDFEDAYDEYKKLRDLGYDVTISTVSAYSTLGWFQDPILSNFSEMDDEDLVELIIHELTHREIYSPGDTDFNENVATFVGRVLTEAFLLQKYGADSEIYRRYLNKKYDYDLFSKFVTEIIAQLNEFYALNISYEEKLKRREIIFERIKVKFKSLKHQFKTDEYTGFIKRHINNASILLLSSYSGEQEIFEQVFKTCERDLKKFIKILKEASSKNTFDYLKNFVHQKDLIR